MENAPEIIARRSTFDGKIVAVYSDGDIADGAGVTFTRHRPLDVATALLVADEAALFDARELPALITAAHRLVPRSPRGVLPGDLRALASRLSDKVGTRPAHVLPPERTVDVAVWTADEVRRRAQGFIACPSGTRRITGRWSDR